MLLTNLIARALVFASGLILGFAMFGEQRRDADLDSAFRGTTDVLGFLSIQSPQSSHYLEILNLLSSAIDKSRQEQHWRGRNKYVGKIFSFVEPREAPSRLEFQESLIVSEHPQDFDSSEQFLNANSPGALPFIESGEVENGCNWDILDLSQWDIFPLVEQGIFETNNN